MNYRIRLTLLTCAAIAFTLIAASFVTYSLARGEAYQQIDDALEGRIALTRAFAKLDEERERSGQAPRGNGANGGGPRVPGVGPGAAGGYTRVLDADGHEVDLTPPRPQDGPNGSQQARQPQPSIEPSQLPRELREQFRQSDVKLPVTDDAKALATGTSRRLLHETLEVDGSRYRLISGRINDDYVMQVARPLDETDEFLDRLLLLLALVTAGGVACGVAAALVVTGAASAPVHRLTELTEAVRSSRDLSQRVAVTGSDELARLARSFNAMLEELERSVAQQHRLVDDASHQLRTPLASLRTNMDVLLRAKSLDEAVARDILGDMSAQVDELTGLVRDLVDLASSVESSVERAPVRLDETAHEAVRLVRGAFEEIEFHVDARETTVSGNEERLVRVVQNLLHNAGKWSPPRGIVDVVVRDEELRVVDRGPGVSDAEKPRIFERFHRAADARDVPGSGLGLAIVQQIVVDHGGAVRVEDTPGGGATFVVSLPPAD